MSRIILTTLCVVMLSGMSFGQNFTDAREPRSEDRRIVPAEYRTVSVNFSELKNELDQAPLQTNARNSSFTIAIPLPNGGEATFKIVAHSVMSPALQEKFPQIKTFKGQGTGEWKNATIRLDYTEKGFHAQVLAPGNSFYIDPYAEGDLNTYIVYTREAFYAQTDKVMPDCDPRENSAVGAPQPQDKPVDGSERRSQRPVRNTPFLESTARTTNGTQLRTYDLALACTGEYASFHGGTTSGAMSAMTTTMNRVNGVFERDLSLEMIMVDNNDDIIYLNSSTDPYSNGNGGAMLSQNQAVCDDEIGSSNYDIGHVFSTGGGGVAYLASVCNSSIKAGGVSGQFAPVGDPFDIDYVSHELGHQWGARHTQNNACNRSSSAAYEPGSASTIMGYAGICPPNLQSNSDDHFHNHSFNEMYAFSVNGSGNTCATISSTGNTPPDVTLTAGGFYIPIETPFELTADATDADDDALTYCWEQYDLGPATAASDDNLTDPSGNAPIFRSFSPVSDPTRVFPRLTDLVNNNITLGEHLPTYSRDLTFRCTVRDNASGGGGVTDEEVAFEATASAGPFLVTGPNTGGVSWLGNTSQTVTWDVANTDEFPVNCTNVDIFLSTDGGFTYPVTLASNVPNTGSASVVVPNIATSQARVKVKAAENIFFDISNQNFTIQEGANNDYDVALQGISSPAGTVCGTTFTPEIVIINLGAVALTTLDISYSIDGSSADPFTWTGNLSSGASASVSLPETTVSSGLHFFNVTLSNPNGNADEETSNNNGSQVFNTVETSGSPLPVDNNFNSPFPGADWVVQNPDGEITWVQDLVGNDPDCNSGNTASIEFYTYDDQGQTDDIETPWVDLTPGTELTFDYAYARYSSFYFDRMQVQIRTACEDNWITLWDKENLDLATAGSQTGPYTPSCGDWSSETIDLSGYSGVVKVRFRGISGWGNNLYLDNIMLNSTAEPDCNGVPGGDALPGTSCTADGGAPGEFDENCECVSTNNPPVANDDSYTTGFNEELVVNSANGLLANDSDPDGDEITAISFQAASFGELNVVTDGSFTYTPDPGASGTETITYNISDGFATSSATLTITVEANNPPVANDDSYTTGFNEELVVTAENGLLSNDSDPDGDEITAISFQAASFGELNVVTDGSFTYTPDPGASGTETLDYTISDGFTTSSGTLTITVEANNPPIANDDSYTTGFNEELVVNAENGLLANDSDPDGDELTVISFQAASFGALNVASDGSFTYTPNPGASGTENLTYTISDGFNTALGNLTITVEEEVDCDGVAGGNAFTDECGICVGGTTGLEPCEEDCNGEFGGDALPGTTCITETEQNGTWSEDCECIPDPISCSLEIIDVLDENDPCFSSSPMIVTVISVSDVLPGSEINVEVIYNEPLEGEQIENYTYPVPDGMNQFPLSLDFLEYGFVYEITLSIGEGELACSDFLVQSIPIVECIDCNGVPGGSDLPGTPCTTDAETDGTWSNECECVPNFIDCNGVPDGDAFVDECGTCVGGDTGLEPCEEDCNGDFGGEAFLDDCGICVGGNTGIEPCTASISGSIDFENLCSARDGTLRIYAPGSDVLVEEIAITVNLDGNFTAESTLIGDFDLYVKVNGYLQKLNANVPLSGGDNTVSFGAVIAGDISGNNQINVTDFSQFSSVYGFTTEDDGFLPLADFNCDGAINVQDFSFFSANYGLVGDQP